MTWEQGRDDFRHFIFLLLWSRTTRPPPPVFSCLRLRTLTHLFSVLANLASSSLLPSFLLYLHPATQPDPKLSHWSVEPIHADTEWAALFFSFFFLLPAVVCVVSMVTTLQLARREMRPDYACGGQRGVS